MHSSILPAVARGDRLWGGLLFLYCFAGVVPLLAYLGFRGVYVALGGLAFSVIVWYCNQRRPNIVVIGIMCLVLVGASIPAIYYSNLRYFAYPIFLMTSLLLVNLGRHGAVQVFCTWSTVFLLISLAGAIIGFTLVRLGLDPVGEISNPDGRPNYWFYTTFSNSYHGKLIRPSGFFDEPGTLSFFCCIVAAMRQLLKRDSRTTWIILLLGFVTLSLAHLIYTLCHLTSQRFNAKQFLHYTFFGIVILALISMSGFGVVVKDELLSRLAFTESGTLVGDNRSIRMANAVEHIAADSKTLFVGVDESCLFDYKECREQFPVMGENPLTPIVFGGLPLSLFYYFMIALYLMAPLFGRRYLVVFGVGLLFLQRPFFADMSYSLAGVVVGYLFLTSMSGAGRIGALRGRA